MRFIFAVFFTLIVGIASAQTPSGGWGPQGPSYGANIFQDLQTAPNFNGTGTNPFRVGGTTIVDSSRNGSLNTLTITGNNTTALTVANGGNTYFNIDATTGTAQLGKFSLGNAPYNTLNAATVTLPSAGGSWSYETDFAFGRNTGARPALHYMTTSDQMWPGNSQVIADDWSFIDSVGGGSFLGNRDTVSQIMQISPSPAMPNLGDQIASFSRTSFANGSYGNGYGGNLTPGAYSQNGWTHNGVILLTSGVKNAQSVWGDEEDIDVQQPVVSRIGYQVGVLTDGTQYQGIFNDSAFTIVNPLAGANGWLCGYCFGASIASWAIDPNFGTMIGAQPRAYSGTDIVGALFGIDLRPVTFASGGGSLDLPNMAVDPTGAVHAQALNTTGVVRGETATLTGLTILTDSDGISGGLYTSAPTITIGAPPSGVMALAVPATYTLGRIIGFASTGSGYTNNDVLTGVGGAGTQPTYRVTGVDANGGVTSCSVNTAGALTSLPTTNLVYPTGGTGAHAGFYITYGANGPTACTPGVTGKSYLVGDTITHTATGTPGILTVDTIDAFGGILTAHVSTAGNMTAPPFPSTAILVTGGSGTGANLGLGFSIATTTISNAGSGYVKEPPIVTTTQSAYRNARFLAQMTGSEAPLSLNPSGQKASFGQTNAGLDGAVFTQTAPVTVANTVAETTLTGTGQGALTLPANFFVPGRTIKIILAGFHSAIGGPTIDVRIKLGSNILLDTGAVNTSNSTNAYIELRGYITCATTGVSGTVNAQGKYSEAGGGANEFGMVNTSPITINTTISQTLNITAQWGTASSSDTITATNVMIETEN